MKKSVRFWILLAGSLSACALYLFQIYLSQKIYIQQKGLMEAQQIISLGGNYEASWKQLATRLYQTSSQDPALGEVLKRNQIAVQPNKPGTSSPAPSPSSVPASSKVKAPSAP